MNLFEPILTVNLIMKAFVILIISTFFGSLGYAQDFHQQEYNLDILGIYGIDMFHGGGGVSFVDWNGDGFDDISFATNDGQDPIFFENTGDGFELVSPSFVSNTYEQKQILWIDYDNDGDKDLYISAYNGPNYLYQNDGAMNLTDVTASVGLPTNSEETIGVTFADANFDGYLDLYQSNHGPNGSQGGENKFFIFDPFSNQFVDVTIQSGTANGQRLTFCSTFFDFDRDGDLDLYVANDKPSQENSLYMSIGGASYVDVSIPSNSNIAINAMNTAVGDYNNDGYFDIYITNDNTNPAVLLKNNGDNSFSDVTAVAGVGFNRNGWSANFLDYDNDMDLDLYAASYDFGSSNPSAMFVNDGAGSFTEPLATTGGLAGMDTIGAHVNAYGDFNNDGILDIVVNRILEENFSLFSGHTENENNYLAVKLEGTNATKDAYGSIIEVWIDGNSRVYATHSTHAYLSQNTDTQFFGLGTNTAIDSMQIFWPSSTGLETILGSDLLVNGMNEIVEGSGVVNSYTTKLCLDNQDLVIDPLPSQIYGATQELSTSSNVVSGSEVEFRSLQNITLDIEFEVEVGAEFTAEINDCIN